ncbi:C2 domain-containing protein 5-like [Physella acuta]|uniref:C2 domain-containing protein 5-like n=1 Tax=Physella acuta TaxID=109671 RepID=UPI0027DC2731|nr:C2 domain-containing protein 5-like [Physella acuta]
MPGKVKVRILSARDLPVMDRASELTDAFVEIRFGNETFKTDVCKKSLRPQWNSEWFKFEVDDEVLQDEPLDLRVLDYDTYSAHDTIGKVYIDLNPLLSRENSTISGWFPIYDTMHGLRGELNIQVRVELFSDFNKFRQSSCGIQFFCTCEVPSGWRIQGILGFVEELVVNDDPEYQWIEKIRTPRASNEARQRLFSKLSGTLQRKLGVKVLEMGGNAVLGYFQNFDLEGESGIVVRGIGTAVALTRLQIGQLSPAVVTSNSVSPVKDMRRHTVSLHHRNTTNSQIKSEKHVHPPLNRQLSSPGPSPSTSPSTMSPKSGIFSRQTSLSNSRSPPPSAPPYILQKESPSQSLFTFPCSSSFPEDFSLSSNTLTPQSQPTDTSQEVFTSETKSTSLQAISSSAPTSPPISPPIHQQHSLRHSTSPVRVGPCTESSRRLSDSEISSPPKVSTMGNNTRAAPVNTSALQNPNFAKASLIQQSIDLLEYPFFTMRSFPPNFIVSLGGVVSARSVKLLDKIHNPEEAETRDAWWSEVRIEIKAHASKLGCHAVLGYLEQTTICDEVIVLAAMGTAAKINLNFDLHGGVNSAGSLATPLPPLSSGALSEKAPAGTGEKEKDKHLYVDIGLANQVQMKVWTCPDSQEEPLVKCTLCHIPYNPVNLPFEIQLSKCAICRKKSVPEVLFTTVDPPQDIPIWSKGCLIQARLCRAKNKNKSSEQSAREISDMLPFIEYELHNQLINKLKIRGLNSLFGLRIQICLGVNMIVAVATATGVYLGPLPAPPQPKISTEVATAQESQDLITLQKRIIRTVQMHRERLGTDIVDRQQEHSPHSLIADDEVDKDDSGGNFCLEETSDKNTFVLVIDDLKDNAVAMILHDVIPPEGFDLCNTQIPPGVSPERISGNLQMFTQNVLVRYQPTINCSLDFSNIFNTILRRLCFKLRHFKPCYLVDICFNVDLPDEDEINVAVTGCCLGLQDVSQPSSTSASSTKMFTRLQNASRPNSAVLAPSNQSDDMMFPIEGVDPQTQPTSTVSTHLFHCVLFLDSAVLAPSNQSDDIMFPIEGVDPQTQSTSTVSTHLFHCVLFLCMFIWPPPAIQGVDPQTQPTSTVSTHLFHCVLFLDSTVLAPSNQSDDIMFPIEGVDPQTQSTSTVSTHLFHCVLFLDSAVLAPSNQSDDMMFPIEGVDPQTQSTSTVSTHLFHCVLFLDSAVLAPSNQTDDMMFPIEGVDPQTQSTSTVSTHPAVSRLNSMANQLGRSLKQIRDSPRTKFPPTLGIELTPMNVVYNGRIDKYLGYYNFFFIRESTAVKEYGGVGGFMQSFILEVMAIVRAHVAALGGNALLAYNMSHCILENNPQKNQGQCLINVSGDIVVVVHEGEDRDSIIMETPVTVPTPIS